MKFVRALSRILLLSLAAAAFAGLTDVYGTSLRPPPPGPRFLAAHWHRPPAPNLGRFPEFLGAGLAMAVFAVGGRLVFRLRLSPASRRDFNRSM